MKEKIVFHVDVNNAFLSWTATYLLLNGFKQDIRKIPSIIGGDEKERKGIVLAKSPIAKKYGIQTAQTIYQAKKICPNLQIYPPNYEWYYQKSLELYTYLKNYSPVIERFSIDECFLDMSGTTYLYNDYIKLANDMKNEIKKRFGYTVNIGIGNNKLCAKMASDFEKPDKVHTLFKNEIKEKLWPLDVNELFMCGKKTTAILNKLKIYTIKDLASANEKILQKYFKNQAQSLINAANGIDYSKIEEKTSKNQSISLSETLPHDLEDEEQIKEILFRQTTEVTRQLRKKNLYTKTVAIIYKNNKFENYSAQASFNNFTNDTKEIYKLVIYIFSKSYKKDPLRLLGIRLSNFNAHKEEQLDLFTSESNISDANKEIQNTIDNINEKFGKSLITPASLKLIGISKSRNKYK